MKKIIIKLSIIVIVLIILDYSLGLFLDKALKHAPDGRYYKANYSLNKCNEDVIIFGSSRAESNYAPFVFEDSLKLSCWNTGRGGQMLPFWYAMEKGILSRYTPKIAIVNIEHDFLSEDLKKGYERAGFLRPFYYENSEIRPIINNISKYEEFLLNSRIYAFNSSFYYLFRPYLVKGLDGKINDKGWKTNQSAKLDVQETITSNTNTNLNEQSVQLFEKFIEDLKTKGCKIYVVISPNYGSLIKSTSTIEYVKKMKNLTLINFSNDSLFADNPNYYKDAYHLNTQGAIAYSQEVSHVILKHEQAIQ